MPLPQLSKYYTIPPDECGWSPYPRGASQEVINCRVEQILEPRLGETRIKVGSLEAGVAFFWFDNDTPKEPTQFMVVARPEGW